MGETKKYRYCKVWITTDYFNKSLFYFRTSNLENDNFDGDIDFLIEHMFVGLYTRSGIKEVKSINEDFHPIVLDVDDLHKLN